MVDVFESLRTVKLPCKHPDGCKADNGKPGTARANGWCGLHYRRMHEDGHPGPAGRIEKRKRRSVMGGVGSGARAMPAKLKLLNGRTDHTDSGGKSVNPGPSFVRVPPEPPARGEYELFGARALQEWNRIVPGLARLDLLKPEAYGALVTHCIMWELVITSPPASKIFFQAVAEYRRGCSEFGLTPASEQRLPATLPQAAIDDPFTPKRDAGVSSPDPRKLPSNPGLHKGTLDSTNMGRPKKVL